MIQLIAKTILNGDAIKKLYPRSNISRAGELISDQAADIHEYYVFGIIGSPDLADRIREYNLVNISSANNCIVMSSNKHRLILLASYMSQAEDTLENQFAAYLTSGFPEIFKTIPRGSNGALMIWKM